MSQKKNSLISKDRYNRAKLLKALVSLGILRYNPPETGMIPMIKFFRGFQFTIDRMNLGGQFGLKEAKDYVEKHWPGRWVWELRTSGIM